MPKHLTTIAIKRRSLTARVQRALAKEERQLRVDRRDRQTALLLIDTKRRAIVETDVDLEKLGRDLGVLQPWERLEA